MDGYFSCNSTFGFSGCFLVYHDVATHPDVGGEAVAGVEGDGLQLAEGGEAEGEGDQLAGRPLPADPLRTWQRRHHSAEARPLVAALTDGAGLDCSRYTSA